MHYTSHLTPTVTPQSKPISGREADMKPNQAGGFGFKNSDWTLFNHFLLIGTEGGTFYEGEHELTIKAAAATERCIIADGKRAVDEIVRVSEAGLAPSNDPAIFALALAGSRGSEETIRYALTAMHHVCRTASHLFQFIAAIDPLRGWGRGLRTAVGNWYTQKTPEAIAFQAIKYRNRAGITHPDALALSHPKPTDVITANVLSWIVGKGNLLENAPPILAAFEEVQKTDNKRRVIELIQTTRLPFEAIPYQWLADKDVWEALLVELPYTATLRNLAKLTSVGVIGPFSNGNKLVTDRLTDSTRIKKARVHPLAILKALKQYSTGRGLRGELVWKPERAVMDALDAAFYSAFDNVEPSGKNLLVAVDISGSMQNEHVAAISNMSSAEAAAALAMCFIRSEPNTHLISFGTSTHVENLSPSMRLDQVMQAMNQYNEGTDCAQPILYAAAHKLPVDGILILSDNQTWAGNDHASEALKTFRKQINRPVRMVNVQTSVNDTSITDPDDELSLEMAGFGPNIQSVASLFFGANDNAE